MASIIVDDTSTQFTFGVTGSNWTEVPASHFYGGSATFPAYAQDGVGGFVGYGAFSFVFQGISVAFFGNTPDPVDSQWAFVSIDGNPAYNTSYADPAPPSTRQWYQSPILPDALHNITITHLASTAVDYAVVTAGPSTNLSGVAVIVDDGDPSVTYQGSWTRHGTINATDGVLLPYGNGTHQTTSTDAYATFIFNGTGVTVGGIFAWDIVGTLSVNYTLDSVSSTQTYTVNSPNEVKSHDAIKQSNFVLFNNSAPLTDGSHTLQMHVTNCVNQTLILDYILYNPSSNTLTTNSIPSGHATTSHSTGTSTPLNSSTNKSTPIGAIVGGVLGGVLFLVVVVVLLVLYRKKHFNRQTSSQPMAVASPGALSLQPYTMSSPLIDEAEGAHVAQADIETGGLKSPMRKMGLSSPASSRAVVSSPASPRNQGRLQNRMNRLQALFEELHQEVAASGGDGTDNVRVAELRGRIAELVREETVSSPAMAGSASGSGSVSGAGSTQSPMSEIGTIPPPAYEHG